jgi:RNAse (barnase) inhibitor barstar
MKYYIEFDKLKRQIEIPVKIEYIWKHFGRRKKEVSALFLTKLVEQLSKRKMFIT